MCWGGSTSRQAETETKGERGANRQREEREWGTEAGLRKRGEEEEEKHPDPSHRQGHSCSSPLTPKRRAQLGQRMKGINPHDSCRLCPPVLELWPQMERKQAPWAKLAPNRSRAEKAVKTHSAPVTVHHPHTEPMWGLCILTDAEAVDQSGCSDFTLPPPQPSSHSSCSFLPLSVYFQFLSVCGCSLLSTLIGPNPSKQEDINKLPAKGFHHCTTRLQRLSSDVTGDVFPLLKVSAWALDAILIL